MKDVVLQFTALNARWFVYADGKVTSNTGFVFTTINAAGTLIQKAYHKAVEAKAAGRKVL